MTTKNIQQKCAEIRANISKIIIGKEHEIDIILAALLSKGHVLVLDMPGTGKTVLAKSLAKSIDADFRRIQFTPDLLPQELTGINFYSPKTGEFSFRKGALFTNILLADEINRATPRTQSGLLEAMDERQITIDGVTYPLLPPYFVIATQNPIETHGTYPLPEAQLDRFLVCLSPGYPTSGESVSMLARFIKDDPLTTLSPVANAAELLEMQESVKDIFVHEDVLKYIVALTEATRRNEKVRIGISSRGAIALMRISQSYAAIQGRGFVTPDDVQTLLPHVFAHRLKTRFDRTADAEIINEIVSEIAVPTEDWGMNKRSM